MAGSVFIICPLCGKADGHQYGCSRAERCDLRAFSECHCQPLASCAVQPKTVVPFIRPERQDIKTVIAFGVLVALLAFGGAHVLNHYEIQYAQEARI